MIFFSKKLTFILLLLTKNSAPNQVKGGPGGGLKQLPDGRYYKPGRSCGILNSIKLLSKMPENVDEIEGCTIIDLSLVSPSKIIGKFVYYTSLHKWFPTWNFWALFQLQNHYILTNHKALYCVYTHEFGRLAQSIRIWKLCVMCLGFDSFIKISLIILCSNNKHILINISSVVES